MTEPLDLTLIWNMNGPEAVARWLRDNNIKDEQEVIVCDVKLTAGAIRREHARQRQGLRH